MKMQDILPVIVSILVIILVAVIEKQSKFVAAVTATMPLAAPLALWIVSSANSDKQEAMVDFSQGLLFGVIPTLGFLIAVWLAARAGLKLAPMLLIGYLVWGTGVGLLYLVKRTFGV